MKKLKIAIVLNLALAAGVIAAITWMTLMTRRAQLSAQGLTMLRYFTIDSNILMGGTALFAAAEQVLILRGKKREQSAFGLALKLASTVGVTLTMLVTACFLAPTSPWGYFSLFTYANFLLHFLNPALSLVVFLGFERTRRIPWRHTLAGVLPALIYAVYYVAQALAHTSDGAVAQGYDWYGFFAWGQRGAILVFGILTGVTYGISWALWRLNRAGGKGAAS